MLLLTCPRISYAAKWIDFGFTSRAKPPRAQATMGLITQKPNLLEILRCQDAKLTGRLTHFLMISRWARMRSWHMVDLLICGEGDTQMTVPSGSAL